MGKFRYNEYGRVLKEEKQYLLIILANVISRFGDSIDAIAYSWLVYGLTGSKAGGFRRCHHCCFCSRIKKG